MTEKIQARLAAVLPTLRTLAQWLGLAGLAGLACGGAGGAFFRCGAQGTALRAGHSLLPFFWSLAASENQRVGSE